MAKTTVLKRAWITAVLAYSVVRTLVIWKIFQKYGVNQYLYLIIDIFCAYWYAIFSTKLVIETSKTHYKNLLKYLLLTLVFNFIPDLYVLATAKEVPSFIFKSYIQIIVLLAIIGLFSLFREVQNRRK
jgi:uncharacterized membrane protein